MIAVIQGISPEGCGLTTMVCMYSQHTGMLTRMHNSMRTTLSGIRRWRLDTGRKLQTGLYSTAEKCTRGRFNRRPVAVATVTSMSVSTHRKLSLWHGGDRIFPAGHIINLMSRWHERDCDIKRRRTAVGASCRCNPLHHIVLAKMNKGLGQCWFFWSWIWNILQKTMLFSINLPSILSVTVSFERFNHICEEGCIYKWKNKYSSSRPIQIWCRSYLWVTRGYLLCWRTFENYR